MSDRIFAQLDQLQRGARGTRARRQLLDEQDYYGHHHAYESKAMPYDEDEMYGDENAYPTDTNANRMTGYEDHYSMYPPEQSQMGPPSWGAHHSRAPASTAREAPNAAFDLSRFRYGDANETASSSSPYDQTLPSSPAVNARRRRSTVPDQKFRPPHEQPAHHGLPLYNNSNINPSFVEHQEDDQYGGELPPNTFEQPTPPVKKRQARKEPSRGTPVVQGISLVSTQTLPDRFRSVFPFPLFNAVQSKCFSTVYNSNDNFILSSPTGSGKTAVLELAILRLMNGLANGSYKIIYQAPTKSLCSERQRDWHKKFALFDLQVAELTGDTDHAQLRGVTHASIIITTPEKWDSITRKWKDHQKLMQMVKLFLIDEVHILKEDRGATLEAIVSRMKSVGCDIRFVALSATVPNSQDIATWLGKDSVTPHIPAPRERFGEEFRPVPLAKHVCGYQSSGNDFAFEKTLNAKLPDIIARWSQRKPIMVFCFTRNSCVETAKLLANWWATQGPRDRYWEAPMKRISVEDKELRDTVPSGVAYHHAGLSVNDRASIEKGYLEGDVNVICCTSTLAVGVNLPCHMVIIKNTVAYQNNGGSGGCKEYSDLEVMQMLGRAGRPQFDKSAVAIILTRLQKQPHYEKMITGQEQVESCLHSNLIDHFNAEIGLGTITSASSAKKWLSGTFLYVRLKENPEHYKIDGDASGSNLEERLELICNKVICLLQDHQLVQKATGLQCTAFGDAMARYYLHFETMKTLLALPEHARTSEILSALAQATEFNDLRFRGGEKAAYKALNQDSSIKFPIPVNLDAPAHKVSLIIQAVLGAIELPSEDHKHRMDFSAAKTLIFSNIQRLIRCVVDCQLYLEDSVTARNALSLARSLGAQVWDDSPLHMKQLDTVGLVSVRKLVAAGLKTVDDIENTEQHRLEHVMSRNPPFGLQLQEKARAFPKLRVGMKVVGDPTIRAGEHAIVRVRADLGFINDKTPEYFRKQPVYVCLLAERSDGLLVHFARISAKKLNKGQEVMFETKMTSATQTIRAHVMCDTIAGTMRSAILQPDIPANVSHTSKAIEANEGQSGKKISKRTTSTSRPGTKRKAADAGLDEFDDAGIDDADLALAANGGFEDIDDFEDDVDPKTKTTTKKQRVPDTRENSTMAHGPRQLENGKWACNHNCKDKTSCKHLCCREGLDKKPKPPKAKAGRKEEQHSVDPKQIQLSMSVSKHAQPPPQRTTPAVQRSPPSGPEMHNLNTLHNNIKSSTPSVPLLHDTGIQKAKPSSPIMLARAGQSRSEAAESARCAARSVYSDDFGDIEDMSLFDENALKDSPLHQDPPAQPESDLFEAGPGDMLDSFSPGDMDNSQIQVPVPAEENWMAGFVQNGFEDHVESSAESFSQGSRQPGITQHNSARFAGQFLEVSDDSAAFGLGIGAGERKSSPTMATQSLANMTIVPEHFPINTAEGVFMEEQPASNDSTRRFFEEELGTDLFNFIG